MSDYDDEGSGILAAAMKSDEPIRVARPSRPGATPERRPSSSLMELANNFFGGGEQPQEETAQVQPQSLAMMRRQARMKANGVAPSGTPQPPGPRSQIPKRSRSAATPSAALGQPESQFSASAAGGKIVRSQSQGVENLRANHNLNQAKMLPIVQPSQSKATPIRSKSYQSHQATIERLALHEDDVMKIMEDPEAFRKLQQVLRKHGAITNEVLKQVLPLYVKHQAASSNGKNKPATEADAAAPTSPR